MICGVPGFAHRTPPDGWDGQPNGVRPTRSAEDAEPVRVRHVHSRYAAEHPETDGTSKPTRPVNQPRGPYCPPITLGPMHTPRIKQDAALSTHLRHVVTPVTRVQPVYPRGKGDDTRGMLAVSQRASHCRTGPSNNPAALATVLPTCYARGRSSPQIKGCLITQSQTAVIIQFSRCTRKPASHANTVEPT